MGTAQILPTPGDTAKAGPKGPGQIAASYPAAARRGLKLFVGEGGCITCHQGANFSDQRFHDVLGSLENGADAGRLAGAISLKNNRLNLTGAYNDDPGRASHGATQRLVVREDMRGQFRTPSLRNVTATAHTCTMAAWTACKTQSGMAATAPLRRRAGR